MLRMYKISYNLVWLKEIRSLCGIEKKII